jgi:hypothetical protein
VSTKPIFNAALEKSLRSNFFWSNLWMLMWGRKSIYHRCTLKTQASSMAARSIASLTLSGLVSIPVRLYSATKAASSVRFNLLAKDGSRLKQQYFPEKTQKVVPRAEMVKGYEFEKDHFVIFTPEELDALEEESSHVVEIVFFIPEKSVDASDTEIIECRGRPATFFCAAHPVYQLPPRITG